MNKIEIKERLRLVEQDIDFISHYGNSQSVIAARAEVASAREKLEKEEEKADKLNAPLLQKLNAQAAELTAELMRPVRASLVMPIPFEKLPKKAQEICERCRRSFAGGSNYKFVWISPKERHGIMTCKGHTSYLDRGSGSKYTPSQFGLVSLDDIGASPYGHGCIIHFEGRLSKEVFKKFTDKAKELESRGDGQ